MVAHLLSQLLRRLRQEDPLNLGGGSCSEPRFRHCTPAWATESETLSQTNKTKQKTKKIPISHRSTHWPDTFVQRMTLASAQDGAGSSEEDKRPGRNVRDCDLAQREDEAQRAR